MFAIQPSQSDALLTENEKLKMQLEIMKLKNQTLKQDKEKMELIVENLTLKHQKRVDELTSEIKQLKAENKELMEVIEVKQKNESQKSLYPVDLNVNQTEVEQPNQMQSLATNTKEEIKEGSKADLMVKKSFPTWNSESTVEYLNRADTEKIVEGIHKYIVGKRAHTNYFSSYESWFIFMKMIQENFLYIYKNFLLFYVDRGSAKKSMPTIYLTDNVCFPTRNEDEYAIPILDEGWIDEENEVLFIKAKGTFRQNLPCFDSTKSKSLRTDKELGNHYLIEAPKKEQCILILVTKETSFNISIPCDLTNANDPCVI